MYRKYSYINALDIRAFASQQYVHDDEERKINNTEF